MSDLPEYAQAIGIAVKRTIALVFASCLFVTGFSSPLKAEKTGSESPYAFQLRDSDGKDHQLEDYAKNDFLVVAFMGTECPLVRLYARRLDGIREDFANKSVGLIAINSNQQDSIAEIQHFVRTHKIEFPVLKDVGNRVADQFNAERTPEIFVLNKSREIVYHGAIDDQFTYGIQKSKSRNNYLIDALTELTSGKPVTTPTTESVGCIIGRLRPTKTQSKVTYSNQISRILQDNCVSCHRAGEIAPFALDEYQEVAGWAGMIEEVVRERRMPPWHADPAVGHFSNDARLTEEERQLIFDWVEAGAPEGDPADLPAKREYLEGWQIGEPDLVVAMDDKPFKVRSRGTIPYKYFVVDPGFKEDKWVKAAEGRPGNREVVHHIIVGIGGEGDFGDRGVHDDLDSEWLAATAPGGKPMVLPKGYAKFVPKGSKLVFQMHYTPNGKKTTDISKVGFVFADPDEVTHRVLTKMALETDFRIPANAENHRVKATMRLGRSAELLALFPHMHYRGKSFSYEIELPNGKREKLLSVPNYDFNWQNAYVLSEARKLPKGTRIHCVAHFDNSSKNLANPNPNKPVYWGDQTWEEMMIGYFDVAVER